MSVRQTLKEVAMEWLADTSHKRVDKANEKIEKYINKYTIFISDIYAITESKIERDGHNKTLKKLIRTILRWWERKHRKENRAGKYEGLIYQARQPATLEACVFQARKQRFTPNRHAIDDAQYCIKEVGNPDVNPNGLSPDDLMVTVLKTRRAPFVTPSWEGMRDWLRLDRGIERDGQMRSAISTARRDLWRWSIRHEQDYGNRDKYVPDYVFQHWGEHREKQDAFIKQCQARSRSGKVCLLDPDKIKRARTSYIAARMDGLPYQHEGAYHAMLTLNLPPVFHRMTHWDDVNKCKLSAPRKNPLWNGMQAFEAMDELRERWDRARAIWAKAGLKRGAVRGCRFVEPHLDGTPHMHCIVSVPSLGKLDDVVRGIATAWYGAGEVSVERHERSSKHGVQWQYEFSPSRAYSGTQAMLKRLVKVDVMQDAAGACRYVDVYVRKHAENGRVKCWLSVNNIRQYSYFGGSMTKRVWDAMGAAGLRCKVAGRDGTGEYDDWAATEALVVSRGIALVDIDDAGDDSKGVLMDGDGEVLHTLERWELIKPGAEVGTFKPRQSDDSHDNEKQVAELRRVCSAVWLGDNGYSWRNTARNALGEIVELSSGQEIRVDDAAVRRLMREMWRGWMSGIPSLVGFS